MPRIPREIQDCSPSTRLVYLLLDVEGALPKQHVKSMTGLGDDTTRRALRELADVDAVLERPDPSDGRRQKYVLREALETDPDDQPAQSQLPHKFK